MRLSHFSGLPDGYPQFEAYTFYAVAIVTMMAL